MWIARDNYNDAYGRGTLTLHLYEPVLNKYRRWVDNTTYGFQCVLPKNKFPELTYENSPQEVKFILPNTALDRGRKDSIIRGLKKLEEDYMLSYAEEIDWLNKLVN